MKLCKLSVLRKMMVLYPYMSPSQRLNLAVLLILDTWRFHNSISLKALDKQNMGSSRNCLGVRG